MPEQKKPQPKQKNSRAQENLKELLIPQARLAKKAQGSLVLG